MLLHLSLAIIYTLAIVYWMKNHKPSDHECSKQINSYSPAMEVVKDLQDTFYKGTFDAPSIFRGAPNPELDLAWDNITKIPNFFPFSDEELERIGKTSESVRFPEDNGGEYAGMLEVFHMLHCVDFLRRYTYYDYYRETELAFQQEPEVVRIHLDHCVEILRQSFMCKADVSVLTYNWIKGQEGPTPNVNARHKCRNFDDVWAWQRDHGKPWGPQWRTGGEIELDQYP